MKHAPHTAPPLSKLEWMTAMEKWRDAPARIVTLQSFTEIGKLKMP